ncbi:malonic semialdehyde reductase [Specibacter sp. AOP5-B1-6]|uniref:malonic semialdehyde reductase n=1 Tax=Specibacter sp. AOP5-B1-6 TaxID=3457653 RepID=UPI00402B9BBC
MAQPRGRPEISRLEDPAWRAPAGDVSDITAGTETMRTPRALSTYEDVISKYQESRPMSIDIASEIDLDSELVLDSTAAAALFLEARTANSWADEEITDETLQAVYALTKMGPTAMNIQPLRISWIRSAEARERLVTHMADGNKAKTLTAPMVAVLSYTNEWHELLPTTAPHAASMVPMFEENVETRNAMAANNAHLQAGYFILAARSAGLAAGPMTGFDAEGLNAEFNADSPFSAFMVINLGKPNGVVDRARLHRLDFDLATATL